MRAIKEGESAGGTEALGFDGRSGRAIKKVEPACEAGGVAESTRGRAEALRIVSSRRVSSDGVVSTWIWAAEGARRPPVEGWSPLGGTRTGLLALKEAHRAVEAAARRQRRELILAEVPLSDGLNKAPQGQEHWSLRGSAHQGKARVRVPSTDTCVE